MNRWSLLSSVFGIPFLHTKDELDEIDIDKEYQLIKQKKSGLSSNLRYRVVKRYEKQLKEQDNGK